MIASIKRGYMRLITLPVISFLLFTCPFQEVVAKENGNPEKVKTINKMFESYISKFPEVKNITPKEARSMENTIMLDVREPKEHEVSRIKDALSLDEFKQNRESYKNKKIIVYCTIGYRSGLFASELLEDGYDAYNLKGGVLLWSHANFDFYNNGKLTNKVHVYSKNWNYLRDNYVGVY